MRWRGCILLETPAFRALFPDPTHAILAVGTQILHPCYTPRLFKLGFLVGHAQGDIGVRDHATCQCEDVGEDGDVTTRQGGWYWTYTMIHIAIQSYY